MVIDSSALVAILRNEPERQVFLDLIGSDPIRSVSAAFFVETCVVILSKQGERGVETVQDLINAASLAVVPFDLIQARIAAEAFRRFGKGRHPAGLNFGDCFFYALADATGEPLLFKGRDFAQTDLRSAA